MITIEQLIDAMPSGNRATLHDYLDPLNAVMGHYNINTPKRQALFLAQVGHESLNLSATHENLNYSADGLLHTWPSRFTVETAHAMARQPEKIANHVYANRLGNGDEASGDGWKFRGRGLIQITGRANYKAFADSQGMMTADIASIFMELPIGSAMSAGWFWDTHKLNSFADAGNIFGATQIINGGQNGDLDRASRYRLALTALTT